MNRPQEQAKFWHRAGLELLHAHYVTHAFSRHIHEGFAIGVITAGGETFYYRGATHIAPAGGIVAINPDEIHTGQAIIPAGWSYRMFYPDAAFMQNLAAEITGRHEAMPTFNDPVIHHPTLATRLAALHRTLENGTDPLECEAEARLVFGDLILTHAANGPRWRDRSSAALTIARVRQYIEQHYQRNITLAELSSVAALSPFHLARLFRQQTGLPPHQYLTHVRIQHARRLLKAHARLPEIALATGFTDQSHLTRHFKRVVGVPPGQYYRE